MKLFNLSLLTVLSFTSSTAYATCYSTGQVGVSSLALAQLSTYCTQQKLAGQYQKNDKRSFCVPFQSFYYKFAVHNLNDGPNFLTPEKCTTNLKTEIGCERGGATSYTGPGMGWRFIADPNYGSC
ncbi:hypothetical protein DSL72_003414 [Monilinia vaccinii-corymbosi]|uniref:Secreted protein n=1 Tax=Monilinia vaccinii-corymbosi TaxID=61207 RepID=A0A8A3P5U7_9HELO|nr:hypothetical protein DSL72_003414 [Monilinia vaccinii-corymbosi]